MNIAGEEGFTSDIDVMACLVDMPRSRELVYKTWEVKVALLCKDGTVRSLKAGKTRRTLTQLKTYRKFGSPDVSLLDVYVCEDGALQANGFPPDSAEEAIIAKGEELQRSGFGYQLMAFQHEKEGDVDVGLCAMSWPYPLSAGGPFDTTMTLVEPRTSAQGEAFSRLVTRIDQFAAEQARRGIRTYVGDQVVFCRSCRELQLIRPKDQIQCPGCQSNLVAQS